MDNRNQDQSQNPENAGLGNAGANKAGGEPQHAEHLKEQEHHQHKEQHAGFDPNKPEQHKEEEHHDHPEHHDDKEHQKGGM